MVNYRDTDIKDKARFYYMLITSSTDEKASVMAVTNSTQIKFYILFKTKNLVSYGGYSQSKTLFLLSYLRGYFKKFKLYMVLFICIGAAKNLFLQ